MDGWPRSRQRDGHGVDPGPTVSASLRIMPGGMCLRLRSCTSFFVVSRFSNVHPSRYDQASATAPAAIQKSGHKSQQNTTQPARKMFLAMRHDMLSRSGAYSLVSAERGAAPSVHE